MDSNHRRQSRQIYSLIPLAAREPLRKNEVAYCPQAQTQCQPRNRLFSLHSGNLREQYSCLGSSITIHNQWFIGDIISRLKVANTLKLFRLVLYPRSHPRLLFTRDRDLKKWCRQRDLNPQPTDYKSVALPIVLCRPITGGDSMQIEHEAQFNVPILLHRGVQSGQYLRLGPAGPLLPHH